MCKHLVNGYLPDDLSDPLSNCFDWFGKVRRRGKRAEKLLFFPVVVPIIVAPSDKDLIVHTWST
jgi:hypothetical protein